MIRINLLPVREDKLIASAKVFLISAVIVIAVVTSIVGLHSTQLSGQEEKSKKALSNIDGQIARLKSIMGEIENLKKKKAEREKKIEMIVRLQQKNIGPVRVLDELSLKLPSNKIWIKKLSLRGNRLQLEGKTLENKEVAQFMRQLENSMFFSNVNLKNIKRENARSKNIPISSYALTSTIYLQGKLNSPKKKNVEKQGGAK